MSVMHGNRMLKNNMLNPNLVKVHTKTQNMTLFGAVTFTYLEAFEKTVAFHKNINHRQAKYFLDHILRMVAFLSSQLENSFKSLLTSKRECFSLK